MSKLAEAVVREGLRHESTAPVCTGFDQMDNQNEVGLSMAHLFEQFGVSILNSSRTYNKSRISGLGQAMYLFALPRVVVGAQGDGTTYPAIAIGEINVKSEMVDAKGRENQRRGIDTYA